MKRNNILRYSLELIVILGYLVMGITVFTYLVQSVPMDNVFIGFVILATGVIAFTEYFTWKYAVRIKTIQSAVAALATVALGIVFIVINMEPALFCIIFGIYGIAYAVTQIITSAMLLTRQPLLNGIKIIISITEIVFGIFLIIRTTNFLHAHMTLICVSLLVEAFVLLIEFMVHRYQGI